MRYKVKVLKCNKPSTIYLYKHSAAFGPPSSPYQLQSEMRVV